MPVPPRDRPPAGYEDWLRALARAMADEGASGRAHPGDARAAPSGDEVLDAPSPGEESPPQAPAQPAPVAEQRVWDLCKPYVVPAVLAAAVGLLLVSFLVSTVNWFFPSVPAPSHQSTFDAQWDAHRRGTDIAAPEVLEKASGKPDEEARGP